MATLPPSELATRITAHGSPSRVCSPAAASCRQYQYRCQTRYVQYS